MVTIFLVSKVRQQALCGRPRINKSPPAEINTRFAFVAETKITRASLVLRHGNCNLEPTPCCNAVVSRNLTIEDPWKSIN